MTLRNISVVTSAACPFCGGHAAVALELMRARVLCGRCGAEGPTVTLHSYTDVGGMNMAVEAWNRRVHTMQPELLPTGG